MSGARAVTITLPLPPTQLHPNVSGGWRAKAGWAKCAREVAMGCAYNVRPAEPFTRCVARADFRFTQHRRRDGDNLMAWLKHSIDGLTDAAIWIDDSVVTWQPPTITVQPGQPGGVTITIEPMEGGG
jgi:Holliday junction resolvase RusA-like endonuclease